MTRRIESQSEQWPDRVAWGSGHPAPREAEPEPVYNPDVTIMHVPEEEGPGYRAIVRRSPDGKGWDVVKPL